MKFQFFFGKHFLTSPYEYSNEWGDDVITSQFSTHVIYKNDKNLIFQLWEYKPCLISTQNKWEIMFILIYFDTRIYFYLYKSGKKWKFSKFHVLNIYDKLWGNDITNSLIWIFIRTGQEMFSKNMWNFKMSQLPYFLSDFHNFCTNLKGNFYSFFWNYGNSRLDFPFNGFVVPDSAFETYSCIKLWNFQVVKIIGGGGAKRYVCHPNIFIGGGGGDCLCHIE